MISSEDLFSKLNMISSENIYYNSTNNVQIMSPNINTCKHTQSICDNKNNIVCDTCGLQLNKNISFEKDRYYGSNDCKFKKDPTRCSFRKETSSKGLLPDCERFNLPKAILLDANMIYEHLSQNNIYRGKKRKGIIFACIYQAYKMNDQPKSCENLIKLLNIEQNTALRGLKYSHTHLEMNKYKIENKQKTNSNSSIEDLIEEIMKEFDATLNQVNEVKELYKSLIVKSSLLNRSRPVSVACGLIKYYIISKGIYIPEIFDCKIKLSNMTLLRIEREINMLCS